MARTRWGTTWVVMWRLSAGGEGTARSAGGASGAWIGAEAPWRVWARGCLLEPDPGHVEVAFAGEGVLSFRGGEVRFRLSQPVGQFGGTSVVPWRTFRWCHAAAS